MIERRMVLGAPKLGPSAELRNVDAAAKHHLGLAESDLAKVKKDGDGLLKAEVPSDVAKRMRQNIELVRDSLNTAEAWLKRLG